MKACIYRASPIGGGMGVALAEAGCTVSAAAPRSRRCATTACGSPGPASQRLSRRVTRKLGAFKTSMLQDVDAGKPREIDALVTAVHELGTLGGTPTPCTAAQWGLVRLMARQRGLYPAQTIKTIATGPYRTSATA